MSHLKDSHIFIKNCKIPEKPKSTQRNTQYYEYVIKNTQYEIVERHIFVKVNYTIKEAYSVYAAGYSSNTRTEFDYKTDTHIVPIGKFDKKSDRVLNNPGKNDKISNTMIIAKNGKYFCFIDCQIAFADRSAYIVADGASKLIKSLCDKDKYYNCGVIKEMISDVDFKVIILDITPREIPKVLDSAKASADPPQAPVELSAGAICGICFEQKNTRVVTDCGDEKRKHATTCRTCWKKSHTCAICGATAKKTDIVMLS